ncbi:LacI family DNA-binding transcriptional regulator [Cellulomonas sp. KRMCY2]|uniref:LacI family DNA-binding transcriptional regulator n=1 Tax=Cellulomonas sp. KRMCY2 TaxID=1304865 RepID=UPI00045EBC0C|nr:LacI family DNA-binding transcriptional regulator [Cellulomonas sp. KRMCY2]
MARVTLQTIADKVGVSRMTVSNAFSKPDQLSAELRRTILAAAEEVGYVGPDPSARALARGTTGAVGVLLTDSVGSAFSDPIAAGFFGSVAEELAPTGLALSLLPSSSGETIPARDIPMDGALVYACAADTTAIDWLVRRRLPLVFVDQPPVPGSASVLLDDRVGSRAAAKHVLDLGHRSIALLAFADGRRGVVADPADAGTGYVSRERVMGWLDVLAVDGVRITAVDLPVNSEQEAYAAARLVLDAPEHPTAVLCFSDVIAWGVLHAAQDLGLQVPDDVSVVGFDDSALAGRVRPALTTVRQDLAAKGRAAALALTTAIERARTGSLAEPEHIVVPTELVVRESTGPAPDRSALRP